jgi:hypothetical protein
LLPHLAAGDGRDSSTTRGIAILTILHSETSQERTALILAAGKKCMHFLSTEIIREKQNRNREKKKVFMIGFCSFAKFC